MKMHESAKSQTFYESNMDYDQYENLEGDFIIL